MTTIKELTKDRLEDFYRYLAFHISENGWEGTTPFLPLSREQSKLTEEMKSMFESGLEKNFGEQDWRKTWVALNRENNIIGHADIRLNDQPNAAHRVILGMGVDGHHRRQKTGFQLLMHVINVCKTDHAISWLDLEVIASNSKAKRLYDKMGFRQVGLTVDMFRIDTVSYDYIAMTLNVES